MRRRPHAGEPRITRLLFSHAHPNPSPTPTTATLSSTLLIRRHEGCEGGGGGVASQSAAAMAPPRRIPTQGGTEVRSHDN